ncbi:hypothetical protein GN958_ATG00802 [Phytophthora infestans]|uniref:Uncharacterized protein n=1 Tax=Phytophthora infestans TaxID=4787 RepID=A0A8S9VFN2_PHYIN|nr:hypothetical protein GN958_ATG00802 [Phytophthora infestans]
MINVPHAGSPAQPTPGSDSVRLGPRLEPRQRSVHVLLAVETCKDLLGFLSAVLHERPRRTLHTHRRSHEQGQHGQNHIQVALDRACVGEEEADSWEQDADWHRYLQSQTQDVTHVWRGQLVRVCTERTRTRGRTRRDTSKQTAGREHDDVRLSTTAPTIMKMQLTNSSFLRILRLLKWPQTNGANHATEDPRVHGERPLELRVAREPEACVVGHRPRVALFGVVVLLQVGR